MGYLYIYMLEFIILSYNLGISVFFCHQLIYLSYIMYTFIGWLVVDCLEHFRRGK